MQQTVLQLMKTYKGNSKLLNEMANTDQSRYKTVAAFLSGQSDGKNQMEAIADETHYLGLDKKQVTWARLNTIKAVASLIDEKKIDIVVCQFRRAIPIGILAAKFSRRKPKVIGVLHGIVGGKVGLGRKIVNWYLYKYLSRIVSVSENGIHDIIRLNWGLDNSRVVAIQNGLNFDPIITAEKKTKADIFGEKYQNKFIFGAVGRLAKVKNHENLIRAFKSVVIDHNNAVLAIIGQGPLETYLQQLVSQLDLDNHVIFTGFRTDIPQVLHTIDTYAMPSLREGLPLALLEAMAAKCPVITSNRSGMKEVVGESPCGVLVEPENIEDISTAMKHLLQCSSEQRETLGENAFQRATGQFSAARMVHDYQALYEEVLT